MASLKSKYSEVCNKFRYENVIGWVNILVDIWLLSNIKQRLKNSLIYKNEIGLSKESKTFPRADVDHIHHKKSVLPKLYILVCICAACECVCVANHRYWKKMLLLPAACVFDRTCIKRQGGRSIYFTMRLHSLASLSPS